MLYCGFMQAIRQGIHGVQVESILVGIYATSKQEAKGKLLEYCLDKFPVNQGCGNHAVGCYEFTQKELQRGLDEISQKNQKIK